MDRSIIQNFISGSLIGYILFSLPNKRERGEEDIEKEVIYRFIEKEKDY